MDKRETLLARSERVIGRSLEQQGSHVHPKPKRSLSRRREQVLQAQRAHRHRTQQYIRELEKEVFHLRDENVSLLQRTRQMQSQLMHARQVLVKHNIPTGSTIDYQPVEADGSLATRDDRENGVQRQDHVSIDLTAISDVIPQGSCENHPAEIAPPTYQPPQHEREACRPGHHTALSTQGALEFVLKLEQPCLAHVKHAHLGYNTGTTPKGIEYNSGPGHLLTASAGIIHQCKSQRPAESVVNLPEADLESLLQASARLQLDNELTPVQIWARVRDSVFSAVVTEETLRVLLSELSKYVYCNSFGAVVEKSTAVALLADILESREEPQQSSAG